MTETPVSALAALVFDRARLTLLTTASVAAASDVVIMACTFTLAAVMSTWTASASTFAAEAMPDAICAFAASS